VYNLSTELFRLELRLLMKFSFSQTDAALLQLGGLLKQSGYRFITSTPLTHARVNARSENQWAKNVRDVFGWSRTFRPEILPAKVWELMNVAEIIEAVEGGYKSTLRLSSLNDEVFFHSAFPTTQNDAVFFGPDTYRFASAIENWIAQSQGTPRRVVDIGCGSGAGAILAARAFPEAEVFAGDINEAALRLTRINASLAGAENVKARFSDLLNGFEENFDLILANPPYLLDATERAYRHGGGSFGEGLSLRIVRAAMQRLNTNGVLLLYSGAAIVEGRDLFQEQIEKCIDATRFTHSYREMDVDVFGEELDNEAYRNAERIAAVVMTLKETVS
jgi:methylase of polypeptide subunit release factors